MKLLFEYRLMPFIGEYLKIAKEVSDYASVEDISDAFLFVMLQKYHNISITNSRAVIDRLLGIDLRLIDRVLEEHLDNYEFSRLARCLSHIDTIDEVKHVGFNVYQITYS